MNVDLTNSISRIVLTSNEGEQAVTLERHESGWTRVEQVLDEDGIALNEFHRRHNVQPAEEVQAFASEHEMVEVWVTGAAPRSFAEWVAPLVDTQTDYISVNDMGFELPLPPKPGSA